MASGIGQFFLGTPSRIEQISRFTKPQQGLQNQSIQQVLSLLRGGAGQQPSLAGFEPIAQRARSQFAQQDIPGLAERFTSLGQNRISSSPAFASQLGTAQTGLEEGLASLGSQYGLQQQGMQQQLLSLLLGNALQPSYENIPVSGQSGAIESLLPSLLKLITSAGAYGLGGSSLALPVLKALFRG